MKKVAIDCRDCGGGGCRKCRDRGTVLAAVERPAGLQMPRHEREFAVARQLCPCYQGISINAGVVQCSHADATDGEYCEADACPVLTPNDGGQRGA